MEGGGGGRNFWLAVYFRIYIRELEEIYRYLYRHGFFGISPCYSVATSYADAQVKLA